MIKFIIGLTVIPFQVLLLQAITKSAFVKYSMTARRQFLPPCGNNSHLKKLLTPTVYGFRFAIVVGLETPGIALPPNFGLVPLGPPDLVLPEYALSFDSTYSAEGLITG